MKKFTKICLITSVVLVLLGGTICILGAISGGWRMIYGMDRSSALWRIVRGVENSYVAERLGYMTYGITDEIVHDVTKDIKDEIDDAWDDAWEDAWDETWDDGEPSLRDISDDRNAIKEEMEHARDDMGSIMENELLKDIPQGDGDTGIASSQVQNMDIEIGGAALCLMESENDNFALKIDGKEKYSCYVSKGTLHLEGGKNHLTDNNRERVYFYIPKGKTFDEVEIDVGGGIIYIGELDAQKVDLTAGAGIISSQRIGCHELDVEVGAGEVVLDGITADKMDLNVGMGVAYIQGGIGREIDAECGMGSIEMELDNEETDFNYEIECSAGAIMLGSKAYGALADDIYVNNRASGKCTLECSMGNIDVIFAR